MGENRTWSRTHFHRKLIRTGDEFESWMSYLLQALPAWNDDSRQKVKSRGNPLKRH